MTPQIVDLQIDLNNPLHFSILALAHLVLGVIANVRGLSMVGTVHSLVALLVGLHFVSQRTWHRVAYVAVYLAGAEVFWRATGSNLLHEYGKYSILLLLAAGILVNMQSIPSPKFPILAVTAIIFLLPGATITFFEVSWFFARRWVSFSLAGPILILVSIIFFSNVRLHASQLKTLMLWLILGSLCLTASSTIEIFEFLDTGQTWSTDSVTGVVGFGANQVATSLGLGAYFCVFCLMYYKNTPFMSGLLIGIASWQLYISFLSFSRGGPLGMLVASVIAVVFNPLLVLNPRRFLLPIGGLLAIFAFVIIPYINTLTNDQFSARFTSADSTGRDRIILDNFEVFLDNPILGTGVGLSRLATEDSKLAHTEFTRLLAEHGILGLFAFCNVMFMLLGRLFTSTTGAIARALKYSLLAWVIITLVHAATRVAAGPLLVGLVMAEIYGNDGEPLPDEPETADDDLVVYSTYPPSYPPTFD